MISILSRLLGTTMVALALVACTASGIQPMSAAAAKAGPKAAPMVAAYAAYSKCVEYEVFKNAGHGAKLNLAEKLCEPKAAAFRAKVLAAGASEQEADATTAQIVKDVHDRIRATNWA